MKNIQIIDGALNCTFSIFQATEAEFLMIFPEAGQDIQYAEDLFDADGQLRQALTALWQRPIRKQDAMGIHGTLFYGLQRYKKWYPNNREDAVEATCINTAQRELFGRNR
jgi:hypothetical protein